MKTVGQIFGWEGLPEYGIGNLVPQSFFRCPALLTVTRVWLRRMTAPFWSPCLAEFDDSLRGKHRWLIRSPVLCSGSRPRGYFVIAMAVCGLELRAAAWYM